MCCKISKPNLANKNNIASFVKKTDFDDKLKNLDKKITSNKTKHVLLENELNKLSEKVIAISTKGLTKDLINTYSILNGAKCFCSRILQICFVFISLKIYIK